MSTFSSLNYHVVFGTKFRRKTILPEFQGRLYEYIGGTIRAKEGRILEIGGIDDHVHILTQIPPTIAVSVMVRDIKANASRWINELRMGDLDKKFAWQIGFGAFTVSHSLVPKVRQYIQNQAEHHRKVDFRDEYLAILQKHEIKFELKYVFEKEFTG